MLQKKQNDLSCLTIEKAITEFCHKKRQSKIMQPKM